MFFYTHNAMSPWTVIKSNDEKRGRLNALRHVLDVLDYADNDSELIGGPDPLIVGSAAGIFEPGEHRRRAYPRL